MSIPFRFKAGGPQVMAPINVPAHHHRSTTKADHKPFKSRHATKSALKDLAKGKFEIGNGPQGRRRTPHQQVMSKLARRNQAKQLRQHHHTQKDSELHIFQGKDGAPRHVAVVPLHPTVSIQDAIEQLNKSVDVDGTTQQGDFTRVHVERFKRNLLYMPSTTNVLQALDICRLADWVILVLPADEAFGGREDEFLRTVEGQGITNVIVVVQGLEASIPAAKRSKHVAQLKADLSIYFPSLEKIGVLDNGADCANLVRSLCTATTKGIRWRDERSWMLVEDVNWDETAEGFTTSHVNVTGIVRGKTLKSDRIVHLPVWGDFQVGRIVEIPSSKYKRKADEMTMDDPPREWNTTENKDDLAELAPEVSNAMDTVSTMASTETKGVLLDDHHYFSDDLSHIPAAPKRLPRGTSSYQAAWYLEDVSDSDSDILDDEQDGDIVMDAAAEFGPEDGVITNAADAMTEGGPTEYAGSEMHVDADDADEQRQLEEYRASRKDEAEEDLEFPDEIELSSNVLARERLAKYRGLKDLRRSEWNTGEDAPFEPLEYKRLLQIADYRKSKNAAFKEALAGGVPIGTRVMVQLLNVPTSLRTSAKPISLFSLLRHEHKHTVVNLNLTLHSSAAQPLRSKEELVVQIGPRRLVVHPIYSAGGVTPNDVHKFDRFLHPGRTATASFIGPLTWGSVPVLVFKPFQRVTDDAPELVDAMITDKPTDTSTRLALIGTATTIPPSSSRIIAKRVILTGHPYKIHKKLVTIRYMFFNTEDVAWFKALPLWTKRGRSGYIKESLGTHGYFKATFDGKINPMDAVGVSLYKRVWPRTSRPFVA